MPSATGTATIDFGSAPGSNEASVTVTGQTSISATSKAEAWFMSESASADHTVGDHRYVPLFCALTCGSLVDGVGFTIYGRAIDKLQGTWTVSWVWSHA